MLGVKRESAFDPLTPEPFRPITTGIQFNNPEVAERVNAQIGNFVNMSRSIEGPWVEVAREAARVDNEIASELERKYGPPVGAARELFLSGIPGYEGRGSNVTGDVPTGYHGITKKSLIATGRGDLDPENLTPKEAWETAIDYSAYIDRTLEAIPNYTLAPVTVQAALIDLGYNAGPENVAKYKKLGAAMGERDWMRALEEGTLDVVSSKGMALRGLAARRAWNYNEAAKKLGYDNRILGVTQFDDGRIVYRDLDGYMMSVTPRAGKHPDSLNGFLRVENAYE